MTVSVLWLFLTLPWVDLQFVIVMQLYSLAFCGACEQNQNVIQKTISKRIISKRTFVLVHGILVHINFALNHS